MMLDNHTDTIGFIIPFIFIIIESMRKRFTYPRIGYAKLRVQGTHQVIMIWVVALLLVLGIVFMFIFSSKPNFTEKSSNMMRNIMMPLIALAVTGLMIYRYLKEKNSLLIYYALFIVLIALSVFVLHFKREIVLYALLAFGALNLVFGVISLIHFIRQYPVLSENE